MKIGDLVVMKHPMGHWRGIGIIVGYPNFETHGWSDCVQVDWITMGGSGNRKALHRIFDLEPVI